MQTQQQVSLLEFWIASEVDSIWFVSHGHPAGKELIHDTDTEDAEEYCDINEAIEFLGDLDQYTGTVEGSTWARDGNSGEPCDWNRNTIVNLKAFAK